MDTVMENDQGKLKKRMTPEHRQKMQENRELKSTCMNCGQQGHFTKNCQNEKIKINEIVKDISAIWAMLRINGKEVRIIIDSGAAVSVISNNLRKKLGIDDIRPSRSSFTIANGTKVASIEKIKIMLEINDNIKIPVVIEVMDKDREELILGNDILGKKDSVIDFENKEVRIIEQEEVYGEEEYSDQENEYESEYEEEQEQELFGIIEEEAK
ncbi:ribonuclease H-like domain-containing protein [Rhizophagus clarus]|uniref:Ribonuclease H-like domain-containing protein n=1 Tax=Rhizophagus clarus TaxID=94130 RepID=A0A8H3MFQ1_9GLOM|nr:ribonuclease H-like domain-containing protein [Rhizophagus clarus]